MLRCARTVRLPVRRNNFNAQWVSTTSGKFVATSRKDETLKLRGSARSVALLLGAISLTIGALAASPATADGNGGQTAPQAPSTSGDDRGLGTPSPEPSGMSALADTYVFREHSTANHERVDIRDDRLDHVVTQHNVKFATLVRVIEWARSPRCWTSADGVDRGIYKYKIYEYVNGEKTGRWVIFQAIIEWGDGHADRGWLVTAYPVSTNSGPPPRKNGKNWTPNWANTAQWGPPNSEILPGCN
jgi:hypothetical protein